jgi:hypothetical protein
LESIGENKIDLRAEIDRARRRELGLLDTEWWHGTEGGYTHKKCRCSDCTKVSNFRRRLRENRQKMSDPQYIKKLEWWAKSREQRRSERRKEIREQKQIVTVEKMIKLNILPKYNEKYKGLKTLYEQRTQRLL